VAYPTCRTGAEELARAGELGGRDLAIEVHELRLPLGSTMMLAGFVAVHDLLLVGVVQGLRHRAVGRRASRHSIRPRHALEASRLQVLGAM
jgi:hypothetical protein